MHWLSFTLKINDLYINPTYVFMIYFDKIIQ